MTDDGYQVMAKAHVALGKVSKIIDMYYKRLQYWNKYAIIWI